MKLENPKDSWRQDQVIIYVRRFSVQIAKAKTFVAEIYSYDSWLMLALKACALEPLSMPSGQDLRRLWATIDER
jgi:hypothetical protein